MSSSNEIENGSEPEGSAADAADGVPPPTNVHKQHLPGRAGPHLGDRLLRLPEVLRRYPVSRSTWYDGVRRGKYPKPVRMSDRTVGWREKAIQALMLG